MEPRSRHIFALLCAVLVAAGCDKPAEVTSYRVPKHEVIQVPVDTPDKPQRPQLPPPRGPMMGQMSQKPTTNQRMLAALVLLDDMAWSFKAQAPIEQFPDDAVEKFDQLVKTFEFNGSEKPKWNLSEDWDEQPPSNSVRVANLMLGDLEFSVIPVTSGGMSETECILRNVNRWRGQVGLSEIEADELEEQTRQLQTADDRAALMLDIRSPKSQSPQVAESTPEAPTNASGITGATPDSWQQIRPGMMQKLAYSADGEAGKTKVTVSIAGGPVLANVNRWRGQVGLAAVENIEALNLEDVTINEEPGLLAEIFGEEGQSMVVAMMPADQPRWFFKLMGETKTVKAEAAAFREYISTVKIDR